MKDTGGRWLTPTNAPQKKMFCQKVKLRPEAEADHGETEMKRVKLNLKPEAVEADSAPPEA